MEVHKQTHAYIKELSSNKISTQFWMKGCLLTPTSAYPPLPPPSFIASSSSSSSLHSSPLFTSGLRVCARSSRLYPPHPPIGIIHPLPLWCFPLTLATPPLPSPLHSIKGTAAPQPEVVQEAVLQDPHSSTQPGIHTLLHTPGREVTARATHRKALSRRH